MALVGGMRMCVVKTNTHLTQHDCVDLADVVLVLCDAARVCAHLPGKPRIVDKMLHGSGERVYALDGDEVTVMAVDHGFSTARCIRGDYGPAHGHRFKYSAWRSFAIRRQNVDATCGDGGSHIV